MSTLPQTENGEHTGKSESLSWKVKVKFRIYKTPVGFCFVFISSVLQIDRSGFQECCLCSYDMMDGGLVWILSVIKTSFHDTHTDSKNKS